MTGGQSQQVNPLNQGRYVGNPNHGGIQNTAMRNPDGSTMGSGSIGTLVPPSRLETGGIGLRLPGADLQSQQPDYMKGFRPPGISTMDVRQYMLDGKQMSGSSTYINALQDHLKSIGRSDLFSEGIGNQKLGLQGIRDENGNLVNNPVAPINRTPINGAQVGGTIGAVAPQPANINTMAAEAIKAAGAGTAAGMGYQPQQVSVAGNSASVNPTNVTGTNVTGTNVTPQTLANTNLSPYFNPYDDAVVKANEADILRGAQMGMNSLQGQAQAAGAFGGSRHGVAMGEIGRDTVNQLAQASAGLRQAGFQNAQNAAFQDIGNNFQGQLANQANNLQAQGMNQGNNLQAQLANQSTNMQGQLANQSAGLQDINNRLQASLANQSAGLQGANQRLGAANQLGQLANLGFGMGQTVNNNLMAQGAMQQALQQSVLDAAANKYAGYVNHPAQGLAYLNAALGVTPTTPQTTTTTKQPGLFDYLTLGASGYTGS